MRILHVEDDDTFRKSVKQGLKESGFAVDGACNAKVRPVMHGVTLIAKRRKRIIEMNTPEGVVL